MSKITLVGKASVAAGPFGRSGEASGMGEVYRAHDTRLGRDVAIKVLSPHLAATPEVRARFEREARTISQLSHPHICTLFDVGREGETDYLVMELLEGRRSPIGWRRGRCRWPRCSRWARRSPTRWIARTGRGWCTVTSPAACKAEARGNCLLSG